MEPRKPSVKKINEFLGDILRHDGRHSAREIREAMTGAGSMEKINRMIGGHGVEAIRDPESYDSYYGDVVALYINMGDTYNPTVVFDIEKQSFEVTTWGDWVEKSERRGHQFR